MSNPNPSQINNAKQELVKLLAMEEGFVGAGVASSKVVDLEIVVRVKDRNSAVVAHVPKVWQGFSVRTEVSGTPRKFEKS